MEEEDLKVLDGGLLSYKQFRKLFPATRNFHKYDHITRADRASSFRLGHQQRKADGEYFYTHLLIPDRAFDTAGQATEGAYQIYIARFSKTETRLENAAPMATHSSVG